MGFVMLDHLTINEIIKPEQFVVDQCVRQNATTPEDFAGMGLAVGAISASWVHGGCRPIPITAEIIKHLWVTVMNQERPTYRYGPATFANGNEGAPAYQISRLIDQLVKNQKDMKPIEFYWEFERIHPFFDGNGRVGAILYNMSHNTFWRNPPELAW
jgi:hypothetical protein